MVSGAVRNRFSSGAMADMLVPRATNTITDVTKRRCVRVSLKASFWLQRVVGLRAFMAHLTSRRDARPGADKQKRPPRLNAQRRRHLCPSART